MRSFGNWTRKLAIAPLAVAMLQAAVGRAQDAVPVDPSLPPYRPTVAVSGSIEARTGMDTVQGMMRAWLEAFRKYHPGVNINLATQDGLGPEERIAMGLNTAELFHPDMAAYEDKYGYEPFRVAICLGAYILKSHVSAIGVFVNTNNPLQQISLAQLDAIYSDARRRGYPADITTWGQLGLTGDWADKPVHALGFYWRDDVTWYFRDMVDYGAPFKSS